MTLKARLLVGTGTGRPCTVCASLLIRRTLLLSQSLATYGTDSSSFNRISHSLQENTLLRRQETFDPERLHPDALKDLYSALLEEARTGGSYTAGGKEVNGVNGTDAASELGSRKRKLSSPPVDPSASPRQNPSTVTQLIDGLYRRYKDHVIHHIRDDEQLFRKVQQDIREIEHGLWDQRLLSQLPVVEARDELAPITNRRADHDALHPALADPRRDSLPARNDQIPGVPPITAPAGISEPLEIRDGGLSAESDRVVASEPQHPEPVPVQGQVRSLVEGAETSMAEEAKTNDDAGESTDPVNPSLQTQIEATAFEERESIQAQQADVAVQETPSPVAHLILPSVAPGLGQQENVPAHNVPAEANTSQQMVNGMRDMNLSVKIPSSSTEPPYHPLSGALSAIYPAPASDTYPQSISATLSTSSAAGGPPAEVIEQPVLLSQVSHTPLAPMTTHTATPQPPSPAHTPIHLPSSTTHTPVHQAIPSSLPSRNYSADPPPNSEAPSLLESSTVTSALPHPLLGQPSPPAMAKTIPSPPMQEPHQEPQSYATLPLRPSPTDRGMPSAFESTPAPIQKSVEEDLEPQQIFKTPVMSISPWHRGHGLLSIDTSVSSTRWKPLGEVEAYNSPQTPEAPPYSPLSEVEVSPSEWPDVRRTTISQPRGNELPSQLESVPARSRRSPSSSNQTENGQEIPKIKARKSEGVEEMTPASHGPGSIRTRSQSLRLQAAETPLPIDSTYSDRIKEEPSTSVPISAGEDTDGVDQAPPNTRLRSSTRLSTNASNEDRTTRNMSTLGKRKRGSLEVLETSDTSGMGKDLVSPTVGHPHILATRNFPRTTAPLLNDIGAHRFASIFAAPVKEKDAPGYKDIIHQPQDLKSIKAAIANGSKAVAAYNAPENAAGSPGQPGTSSSNTPSSAKTNSTLWIPRNPDVIPPKGIVNSTQLEKELMRMFANAVMFNPDPDRGFGISFRNGEDDEGDADEVDHGEDDERGGVVKDTREMFEHVEKLVADWRAAERTAEAGADRSTKSKATRGASAESEGDGMPSATNGGARDDGPDLEEGSVGTVKRRRRN